MATKQKTDDLDTIVPVSGEVTIDGVTYKVKRIKLIELASLLRVISVGLGPALASSKFEIDDSEELLGLIVLAIPNAIEEFIGFVNLVIDPVDGEGGKPAALVNPEPEVVLDIIGVVLDQEKDDWKALLGKAQALFSQQIRPLMAGIGESKTG